MLDGVALWHALHDGYMLVLAMSALCLVLASAGREARGGWPSLRALGWLRSFGQLSYEIYLTHMFVVFAVVRWFRLSGSDASLGYLWYVPAVCRVGCWVCWWRASFRFPAIAPCARCR
jgi:peptidoglycan/LPS O-acetylase OafA/YrhL